MKTMDGSKMSESMNSEYDAVFTKKSFEKIDNSDMKTLVVEKIEFLTRLCYRMFEKIEVMEFRTKMMEEKLNKKSWQDRQIENDFRDVKLACDDEQIKAHEFMKINQFGQDQQTDNDFSDVTLACEDRQIGAHKVNMKCNSRQDDLLKYSLEETLMEKEALVNNKRKETWAEKLFSNEGNRRKVKIELQGKAKPENESRKGWKSAPIEFFISNTNVETSIEDVKEAARNFAKIELIEVEKKTKEGATYGSFRIKVELQDYEKCVNEDSWPQGWKIRKFYRNFKVKTDIVEQNVKVKNKENTIKKDAIPKIDKKIIVKEKKGQEVTNKVNKEQELKDKTKEKLRQLNNMDRDIDTRKRLKLGPEADFRTRTVLDEQIKEILRRRNHLARELKVPERINGGQQN